MPWNSHRRTVKFLPADHRCFADPSRHRQPYSDHQRYHRNPHATKNPTPTSPTATTSGIVAGTTPNFSGRLLSGQIPTYWLLCQIPATSGHFTDFRPQYGDHCRTPTYLTLASRWLSVVVVPSSGYCQQSSEIGPECRPGLGLAEFDLIRLQIDPTQFGLVWPNYTFLRPILIVYRGFKVYFWITIVSGLAYHLFVIFVICLYLIIYWYFCIFTHFTIWYLI